MDFLGQCPKNPPPPPPISAPKSEQVMVWVNEEELGAPISSVAIHRVGVDADTRFMG